PDRHPGRPGDPGRRRAVGALAPRLPRPQQARRSAARAARALAAPAGPAPGRRLADLDPHHQAAHAAAVRRGLSPGPSPELAAGDGLGYAGRRIAPEEP